MTRYGLSVCYVDASRYTTISLSYLHDYVLLLVNFFGEQATSSKLIYLCFSEVLFYCLPRTRKEVTYFDAK